MKQATKRLTLVETEERHLPVLTVYYVDRRAREVAKNTRAGSELRGMELCLRHMRRNDYGAALAEVYNTDTGELYGVMKRTVDGQVHPIFQKPLKKGE